MIGVLVMCHVLRSIAIFLLMMGVLSAPLVGRGADTLKFTLGELLGFRCYGIEVPDSESVCLRVHKTHYALDAYKELWTRKEEDDKTEHEFAEDGETVTVRVGQQFRFYTVKAPIEHGPGDAIYVLRGKDLPPEVVVPQGYRTAPILIAFITVTYHGMGQFEYFKYLACPKRNRWLDLQTGREGLLYFPFRTTSVPRSGWEGADPKVDYMGICTALLNVAEDYKNTFESEQIRLSGATPLSVVRELGPGTNLVSFSVRESSALRSCAVVRTDAMAEKSILACAEVRLNGDAFVTRYDECGRVRWVWYGRPRTGEVRTSASCHRFPGDGTVEFSFIQLEGIGRFAYSFRGEKVVLLKDDECLRKTVAEVEEKFRSLFGFSGSGRLTPEEVKKGLE